MPLAPMGLVLITPPLALIGMFERKSTLTGPACMSVWCTSTMCSRENSSAPVTAAAASLKSLDAWAFDAFSSLRSFVAAAVNAVVAVVTQAVAAV